MERLTGGAVRDETGHPTEIPTANSKRWHTVLAPHGRAGPPGQIAWSTQGGQPYRAVAKVCAESRQTLDSLTGIQRFLAGFPDDVWNGHSSVWSRDVKSAGSSRKNGRPAAPKTRSAGPFHRVIL